MTNMRYGDDDDDGDDVYYCDDDDDGKECTAAMRYEGRDDPAKIGCEEWRALPAFSRTAGQDETNIYPLPFYTERPINRHPPSAPGIYVHLTLKGSNKMYSI